MKPFWRHIIVAAACLVACIAAAGQSPRERIKFDDEWHFAFGDVSDHGIEPYSLDFQEDSTLWRLVDLPFDFAVDLPFVPEASEGWYRKTFRLNKEDHSKNIRIQFDGILQESDVWVNGVHLGHESNGYISQDYDISSHLFYDGRDNLVCVKADASDKENLRHEGAGIYHHAWLSKSAPLHITTNGVSVHTELANNYTTALVTIETEVANDGDPAGEYTLEYKIIAPDGKIAARGNEKCPGLNPGEMHKMTKTLSVDNPKLWNLKYAITSAGNIKPDLYDVKVNIVRNGAKVDTRTVRTALREIRIDPDKGLFLNGEHITLRGFNVHHNHAGVGIGIPDGLQEDRIEDLKMHNINVYHSNNITPAVRALCDEFGLLILDELDEKCLFGHAYMKHNDIDSSLICIKDDCGFDTEEAYRLEAYWETGIPHIEIFPHWNFKGHEGELVTLRLYGDCDEVKLKVNNRSIGVKQMPESKCLEWQTIYEPGELLAIGNIKDDTFKAFGLIQTTGKANHVQRDWSASRDDIHIRTFHLKDAKEHFTATACNDLKIKVTGDTKILGWGNGDPAYNGPQRPLPPTLSEAANQPDTQEITIKAYNGKAQLILKTTSPNFKVDISVME